MDDIIIFCKKGSIRHTWRTIHATLKNLSLEVNADKSTKKWASSRLSQGLDFLGYSFSSKGVSVRPKALKRFLNSLLGKITKCKSALDEARRDELEQKKDFFISEINEKITGAIDGKRRYGSIFFYSEITDLGLLHQIDRIIIEAVERINSFSAADRSKVKKIVRAFYKSRHTPEAGYIHNYNAYRTTRDKLRYLISTGRLKHDPEASYTDEQINRWFDEAKAANLLKLERDLGMFS